MCKSPKSEIKEKVQYSTIYFIPCSNVKCIGQIVQDEIYVEEKEIVK